MSQVNDLFAPLNVGRYALANRIVMAPMTRSRADDAGVPGELVPVYYAQRASAGLIVTEGTFPSPMGKGYVRTPGIHSDAQVAAWKKVTEAVHGKGSRIFLQLMHAGRISDPSFLPGRATPVAPSAVQPKGASYTDEGMKPFVTPRALETAEVAGVIEEYAQATRRALEAGFDGVELHAASGYLPMQFLSSGSNLRSDRYGGDAEKRVRFTVETLQAMSAAAGPDRVGIKISPEMAFNDITDGNPVETYTTLVRAIGDLGLAYLHVALFGAQTDYHGLLRPLFKGLPRRRGALAGVSGSAPARRQGGRRGVRQPVRGEPGFAAALSAPGAAEPARQRDVLYTGREGIHRLSDARSGGLTQREVS
jgi:N-ethylmaleimide reductase